MYDTRRQVDNLAHMYICSSFRVTGDQFKTGRLDRIQELVGTERAQVASSCTTVTVRTPTRTTVTFCSSTFMGHREEKETGRTSKGAQQVHKGYYWVACMIYDLSVALQHNHFVHNIAILASRAPAIDREYWEGSSDGGKWGEKKEQNQ